MQPVQFEVRYSALKDAKVPYKILAHVITTAYHDSQGRVVMIMTGSHLCVKADAPPAGLCKYAASRNECESKPISLGLSRQCTPCIAR